MNSAPHSKSYLEHVARLERELDVEDALRRAVGGEFIATGKLEYYLLRSCGLRDDSLVVDVGCGSGRLACQLVPFPNIRYVGCDLVPKLLAYARTRCNRADWRFEHTDGIAIPCDHGEADFVCFFSVFTHLHQEDIFRYFREAHRVLKPGGFLVISFLEFRVPTHWHIFAASVNGTRDDEHLNQFIDREAIYTWAAYSDFDVRRVYPGNTEYIPLPEEIRFEDGSCMSRSGSLGQSVAVLQKRQLAEKAPACCSLLQTQGHPTTTKIGASDDGAITPLPATAPVAPVLNASARCFVAAGRAAMLGFIIGGTSNRRLLVRAIGPTLKTFGVDRPLATPLLEVVSSEGECIRDSRDWRGDPLIAAAGGIVGAFSLPRDSKDALVIAALPPGSYTAVVTSENGGDEGEVLIEIYLID